MSFCRPTAFTALALFLILSGCSQERAYEVRGRVSGFGDDPRTLIVEHEDVPGLMPAMTMPFTAKDTSALSTLETGDPVAFTLHIGGDESWIDDVRLLQEDELPAHPAGAPDPAYSDQRPSVLEVGDELPPFQLTTHADTTLQRSELRGKAILLTFIYTRCPLPEFCPLMSRRFAALQPELKERYGDRVHLLSISFDTEHDSPDVLRDYAGRYTDDLSTWTFATGNSAEVKRLAERFGEFYSDSSGEFVHNLVTVLIGPEGRIRSYWRGNEWTAGDVLSHVEDMAMEL